MSFGWSVGDIAECITLLIKIGKALQDPGGSVAEYHSTVDFLKGVETTVQGVENILQNHLDLSFQAAIQEHTTTLMTAVTHFRKKIVEYDNSLGANATTSVPKKTWKKIKLALFGHIDELKVAVSYPQSVVNNLIDLQALDILVDLSKKPTLSPQQFQDSAKEISRNFPILLNTIETLRSDIAEDFITIQQTTESNVQRNFDQIQRNLSDGSSLQKSISAQAQADAEAQDLWREQFQQSITEIQAEAQKHFEALQEMKEAQATNHEHSMQTALQVFSWRNAFRPAASRPVVKVIKKTVIMSPRLTRSAPAAGDGSSRGGSSQGGNSKGGTSRGAGSQGGVSRGESSRGGSSQGGGPRRGNAQGGQNSRGGSLGPSRSRGGLPKEGPHSQGGHSQGGHSQGGHSQGGHSQGGNSQGGHSQGGNSQGSNSQGSNSQGGSSKGGFNSQGSNSQGGNSRGGNSRGGNSQGGNPRGGDTRGGSTNGGSNSRGGNSQGGNTRGGNTRGGNSQGGNSQGGNSKVNNSKGNNSKGNNSQGGGSGSNNVRGGSTRGGSVRGGSVRGGSMRGGSVRGGTVRGVNARTS